MTQEMAQAGAARPEDASNAEGPVGVVDNEAQTSVEEAEQDGQMADATPRDSSDTLEAETDVEEAEDSAEENEEENEEELSDADIIAQLRTELVDAKAKADESVDKLQRTAAEFQNTRRRQERQLSASIDRANADLIRRLLPILDDLDLAFQNAPQRHQGETETAADVEVAKAADVAGDSQQAADEAWMLGFQQIQKKLLNLLEDEGVSPIDASGEFDPQLHEAVLSEVSDEVESGYVIDVLRTGYEFKGHVLRPAMVRVAA